MGGEFQVWDANDEIIDSEDCHYSGLEAIKGFLLRGAVAYLSSLLTSSEDSTKAKNSDIQRAISALNKFIKEPENGLDTLWPRSMGLGMGGMIEIGGIGGIGGIQAEIMRKMNYDIRVRTLIPSLASLLRKFNLIGLVWYLAEDTWDKTQSDEIALMFDTVMPFLEFTPKEHWSPVHREEPYTAADFEEEEANIGIGQREKKESVRARNKRKKAWIAKRERERKRELKKPLFQESIRNLFRACPPDGKVMIQ